MQETFKPLMLAAKLPLSCLQQLQRQGVVFLWQIENSCTTTFKLSLYFLFWTAEAWIKSAIAIITSFNSFYVFYCTEVELILQIEVTIKVFWCHRLEIPPRWLYTVPTSYYFLMVEEKNKNSLKQYHNRQHVQQI